jgi:transposase-like protein
LNDLVRKTVQETLNDMLEAEAQALCNAQRYQRSEARKDCRAGLRYVSGGRWGTRRYMDMNRLKEMQDVEVATADNAAAQPMG